jgi:hypothetical protein
MGLIMLGVEKENILAIPSQKGKGKWLGQMEE